MFRYASFNRPLWIGFDPGTGYKIVEIQKSDEINGRRPHDVFETFIKISPEKIYSLELTDYEEVAEKNKLYAYAKTKLSDRWLDCVNELIHSKKIVYREQIDYYAKKTKVT